MRTQVTCNTHCRASRTGFLSHGKWWHSWCLLTLSLVSSCTPATSEPGPAPDPSDDSASSPSESTSTNSSGDTPLPDGGLSFDQCAAAAVEANEVPANILFILDHSGSMNCVPPDGDAEEATLCKTDPRRRGDGPSKWQVTHASLTAALEPLVGRANVNVAVATFPLAGTRCDVMQEPEIPFSELNPTMVAQATDFLVDVVPDGETPIAGATILGYATVAQQLREGAIRGNVYVVLLTDGTETCKPEELPKLLEKDAPAALSGFGIRTFVIGAPGSEDARLFLSQLAHVGGTDAYKGCNFTDEDGAPDCHFDMTTSVDFEQDLAQVLDQITQTKALVCEFDVPRDPAGGGVDLGKVNVTLVEPLDGGEVRTPIGRYEGAPGSCDDKENGWTYSEDRKHILVCGSDCETVQASSDAQVQIVLGCRSLTREEVR